jgi:hypothetical protein
MLQSKTQKKAKFVHAKRSPKRSQKAEETRSRSAQSGTKQEAVLDLLRQPGGATVATMMQATGWQQHSVRGFLAGMVRKKLQLKLESIMVEGNRVYRITEDAAPKGTGSRAKHRRAA